MTPEFPTLLSLDTATDVAYLGLHHQGRDHVAAEAGGAQTSTTLLPALQALMAEAGVPWSALGAVAYGRGPGAFTGLRTACALAQGLALGRGVPMLGLDTLALVAQAAAAAGAVGRIAVLQDARMGQIYAGLYGRDAAGQMVCEQAPALYDPAPLREELARWAPQAVAGHGLAAHAEALEPALAALEMAGGLSRWPAARPDGAAQLAIARQAWARGERLDPAQALPVYVRDKVAQTTAEREAQKASTAP